MRFVLWNFIMCSFVYIPHGGFLITKTGIFYILSSVLYSRFYCQNKESLLSSKIIQLSQEFKKMNPFRVCPFSIETCSRYLSNPDSLLPINCVDAESTGNFAVLISITDLFLDSTSIFSICTGVKYGSKPGVHKWCRLGVVTRLEKGF
uniref:Uncharacterized protein n=1 Tax=Molossus molossus TaxID=27622 RepID=A0A7J8DC57_MOLMO|nr:hypothetical protein HJG59_009346 [Molossus molossus]